MNWYGDFLRSETEERKQVRAKSLPASQLRFIVQRTQPIERNGMRLRQQSQTERKPDSSIHQPPDNVHFSFARKALRKAFKLRCLFFNVLVMSRPIGLPPHSARCRISFSDTSTRSEARFASIREECVGRCRQISGFSPKIELILAQTRKRRIHPPFIRIWKFERIKVSPWPCVGAGGPIIARKVGSDASESRSRVRLAAVDAQIHWINGAEKKNEVKLDKT